MSFASAAVRSGEAVFVATQAFAEFVLGHVDGGVDIVVAAVGHEVVVPVDVRDEFDVVRVAPVGRDDDLDGGRAGEEVIEFLSLVCLLYTSPSPRD